MTTSTTAIRLGLVTILGGAEDERGDDETITDLLSDRIVEINNLAEEVEGILDGRTSFEPVQGRATLSELRRQVTAAVQGTRKLLAVVRVLESEVTQ